MIWRKLLVFLLCVCSSAHAWDRQSLVGEWQQYSYEYENIYRRISISNDMSGYYMQIYGDKPALVVEFTSEDVRTFDGYAVIELDAPLRIMVTAWGNRPAGMGKRLLGQLFLYSDEDDELSLFNSIPLSMKRASDEGLVKFSKHVDEMLKEFSANKSQQPTADDDG